MNEITLIRRTGDYLVPATQQDREAMFRIKIGEAIRCKFTKQRNISFHRKYFALLNLAFESFEVAELYYKNEIVEKNFDRFRKDIVIMAGFYIPTVNIKGETRLEAKSISFGSMDEDEFSDLYSKTIDVILKYVLRNYSKEDLDKVVDEVINFV